MDKNPETIHIAQMPGSPVVIPDVDLEDVPLSRWEETMGRALLRANGYADDREGWRRAARESDVDVIREAALGLLAVQTRAEDRALLAERLVDRAPLARAWAAEGLIRLGEAGHIDVLQEVSRRPPAPGDSAAFVAARLLGAHGQAQAWPILADNMAGSAERHVIVMNTTTFFALHGASAGPGRTVDVWSFFQAALADPSEAVQHVAVAALAEERSAQALELLRRYVATGPAPALRYKAEEALRRK